ncbi:ATP-binding protein [Streptomyces sp. NPDC050418]|uniref:ATP-binding protein n=1 Tax=Streptomyces sp. NPDC050418 TaxID=3365612 RepID=UPI003796242B
MVVQFKGSEEDNLFVGRLRELSCVDQALREHRLITLTGVAGVGKSRLARHRVNLGLPAELGEVCWADLWQLQDPELLVPLVADAYDLADHTPRMPIEALSMWIGERPKLLVVDSCEHPLEPCRRMVAELLGACPNLTVLATSREPLRLETERVIRVDPLPGATDAIELFTIRATEAGLRLQAVGDGKLVAEVCAQLDGLPLALELAAAQLRSETIEQLGARTLLSLETRDTPRPNGPRRHGALRTAVGWSHELCTPQERLVWARLSVLRGRFDEDAARVVCAYPPLSPTDLSKGLAGLVTKSVVTSERGRCRMLDTIREYGRLWLDELGEAEQAADRHATYHLDLVRQAEHDWAGPGQASWYRTVSALHSDICAAADHLLTWRPDDALELAGLVAFWWTCSGRLHEAQRYVGRALAATDVRGPLRCQGQWAMGLIHILQGDYANGHTHAAACSIEAAATPDHQVGMLRAAYLQGLSHLLQGQPREAMERVDDVLAAVQDGRQDGAAGPALMCRLVRAFALTGSGQLDRARHESELLRDECAAIGEHWTRSYAEYQLCVIGLVEQRATQAVEHARAMLLSKQRIGDSFGIALGLDMLAAALAATKDGKSSALAYGAGDRYWQAVGHPQRGTPDVAPLREQGTREARDFIGSVDYERWYGHAARSEPESMLAWAVTGRLPA